MDQLFPPLHFCTTVGNQKLDGGNANDGARHCILESDSHAERYMDLLVSRAVCMDSKQYTTYH